MNQISWLIQANTDNYEIQRAPDDGFGSPGTFADIPESPIADPTLTVVHVAGIAGDFYRVRATNAFGAGAYSTVVQKISVAVGDLCNVFGNLADVTGQAKANVKITATLNTKRGQVGNFQLASINASDVLTDAQGNFSFNLIRQTSLQETDSFYTIEFVGQGRKNEDVIVPGQASVQYKDLVRVSS